MFDLTSSKLLILGIVALIVVGPKDLPILLRALGKYMGIIRRQANEFRAQFDEAMRESELEQLKKDVEGVGADMERTMREAETDMEREVAAANAEVDAAMADPTSQPHVEAKHEGANGAAADGEASPGAPDAADAPSSAAADVRPVPEPAKAQI
jgi:sec-independent protein translocase protein TatB